MIAEKQDSSAVMPLLRTHKPARFPSYARQHMSLPEVTTHLRSNVCDKVLEVPRSRSHVARQSFEDAAGESTKQVEMRLTSCMKEVGKVTKEHSEAPKGSSTHAKLSLGAYPALDLMTKKLMTR